MKNNKGFTLIEILIVIALMGAIAIGLLATLDPFQQIKKGQDTTTRNLASDVYRALISYQAVKTSFPWSTNQASELGNGATILSSLSALISAGELKTDFINLAGTANLNKLVFHSVTNAGVWNLNVCFTPASKSFAQDPNAVYTLTGSVGTNCQGTNGASVCAWCIK